MTRSLLGSLVSAAVCVAASVAAPAAAAAQEGESLALAGYFPDEPRPSGGAGSADVFAPTGPAPVRGGVNLGLGFQVPTGGDVDGLGGRREIVGTADLGLSFLLSLYGVVQWDVIGFRGGLGGLNSEYYEDLFGFDEMGGNHFWLGTHLRVHVIPRGPLRPFVSGSLGGDRIVASYRRGTGVFDCEERASGWYACDEITEREFGVGYWGLSTGVGGGLHITLPVDELSLIAEVQGVRARYGRLTSSAFDNRELGDAARTVWSVSTLLLLQVGG
ncbi:MAG: hypothetical protein H6698_06945 [Myxococcales bacterium]|nr:hypothetical protein [Myxococcales bacterium]